ncbi:MAG TPA: MtrB/PioB family outer membrane beta-barrel protein [Casimicrobiaceae bacterium]|jgi:MtrB/PioB family decaheme-associated outer membrane protein
MNRAKLPVLIAGLFVATPALGQTIPWITDMGASIGGLWNNRSGRDLSKIEEYQDLRNGVLSNAWYRGRDDRDWVDFYGENFGRDDQYADLQGGRYDAFKYRVYTNWLPHNMAYGALTPYQGVGSSALTATFPQPSTSTWYPFNLGYERKDTGGYFEWQAASPWYFRVDGNHVEFNGTKVGAGALGTSPGNGFVDLSIPVSNKTNNVSAEAGYSTSKMQLSLNYLYSRFDNDNTTLQWTNPYFGSLQDTTFLPLSNDYQRIAANAVFRQLPMSSTFAARYTWSKTTNDTPIAQQALTVGEPGAGTGLFAPTLPNQGTFNGDMVNQTLSLALNSTPVKNVDTKLYYNWYKLANNSSHIVFAEGGAIDCGGPCDNMLYDYRKNNAGIEGIWRIDRGNRLFAGWDYLDTDQNRVDFNHVRDNRFFVEWKNTSLDVLSTRLKYQYLQRRSDFLLGDAGTSPNDAEFINRFIARFDNSDLNQNYVKFTADWNPMPLFDASFEGTWKHNDYPNTVLGRTKDERHEIFGTLSYGNFSSFRITLMGDYEWVKYDSYHRNISDTAASGAFDPNTPPNSSNYNWAATNKDNNWLIGIGIDWRATDKLQVKGSVQQFKSDGSSDVMSQNNFGNPLPITAYDDWKQTALNLKAIYTLNRNWSFTAGYAYNHTHYDDIAFNGYQYTIPFPGVTNSFTQSYLNGYRAFTNANSNIVYLVVTTRLPY